MRAGAYKVTLIGHVILTRDLHVRLYASMGNVSNKSTEWKEKNRTETKKKLILFYFPSSWQTFPDVPACSQGFGDKHLY